MNIILVFPKQETAKNLRNVLRRSGYSVDAVCSTVAQALQAVSEYDSGLIVSNYKLVDGMAIDIYDSASDRFRFLMIGPKDYVEARAIPDVFSLSTPLHVNEFLSTMEVMSYAYSRWRKKMRARPRQRSREEQETIDRAKELLIERNGLTEEEAHRYIQKSSMDNGTGVVETAYMIMSLILEG
jgi:response regulator NasT